MADASPEQRIFLDERCHEDCHTFREVHRLQQFNSACAHDGSHRIEQFWRDIHARCIIYAADQLQTCLPTDLRARVEERVVVEPGVGTPRSVYPDIRVVERGRERPTASDLAPLPVLTEPLILYVDDEPATQSSIEIIDVGSGRRVVTVIEILRLANKLPGEGQAQYRKKQRELCDGHVNLVEIDLLRAGERVLAVGASRIPAPYRTQYQVCIYRAATTRPCYAIYRVSLRERLPVLRLPLRATDADVPLDLQAILDQCYRNGGYDEDIDYRVAPEPPLEDDDARWADTVLRQAGRRTTAD